MTGHILSSPLPAVASLAAARAAAARLFDADAVAGRVVFYTVTGLPVGVCADGTVRAAEVIGRPDGFAWVVLA